METPISAAVDSILDSTAIVLPTRGRRDCAQAFLRACQHRPLMLVVDAGRESEDAPSDLCGATVVVCPPDCGSVPAMELGIMAMPPACRYFFAANDDLDWVDDAPLHEAARIYAAVLGGKAGVVGMNDGVFGPRLACFAIVSREFYLGYMYPTPYRHYAVDDEWTDRAKALGVWAYAEAAHVRHLALTPRNEAWAAHDVPLYHQRKQSFAQACG